MAENNASEYRSAIDECYSIANEVVNIQDEIETKTQLWKAIGWNYFMKPVPGTTKAEELQYKTSLKSLLITWLGIPAVAVVLGIIFMAVELSFTKGLGGLLLIGGVVMLYVAIIIVPMKLKKIGPLGRMSEQINTIYKGSWKSAKSRIDSLTQTSYNEAKQYINEYTNIGALDKLIKALTPQVSLFSANTKNQQSGGTKATADNIRMILSQSGYVVGNGADVVESAANSQGKIACPKCGSNQLQFSEATTTTGGGTSIDKKNACCGFLLLGPLGLLCGVKNEAKQTNTTRWVCSQCGHKF